MFVMADTSHDPIAPSGPFEQLPTSDFSKHIVTASPSSGLDTGAKIPVDTAHIGRVTLNYGAANEGVWNVVVRTCARSATLWYRRGDNKWTRQNGCQGQFFVFENEAYNVRAYVHA